MTPFGLGDLAYYLLRLPVLAYDWAYGTDLRDCIKCKRRRKEWNARYPRGGWGFIILVTSFILLVWWGK